MAKKKRDKPGKIYVPGMGWLVLTLLRVESFDPDTAAPFECTVVQDDDRMIELASSDVTKNCFILAYVRQDMIDGTYYRATFPHLVEPPPDVPPGVE